jgi:DNA-binding winged helix-turn-helix (wHTH) protein
MLLILTIISYLALLRVLVERAGGPISKDTLIDAV